MKIRCNILGHSWSYYKNLDRSKPAPGAVCIVCDKAAKSDIPLELAHLRDRWSKQLSAKDYQDFVTRLSEAIHLNTNYSKAVAKFQDWQLNDKKYGLLGSALSGNRLGLDAWNTCGGHDWSKLEARTTIWARTLSWGKGEAMHDEYIKIAADKLADLLKNEKQ